jgi:NAD(P)H dehydrogenase (quinone)
MQVTNVLSSHYPGAFVQVLHDHFTKGLKEAGHNAVTIDLYARAYDPVMRGDDFNQFFDKPVPEETLAYQGMVEKSQVLAFFYPVWWNDMPAIMKGWIDRVFTKGFAYDYGNDGHRGMLPVERIILVCTLGNKADDIAQGLEDAMRAKERDGVFGYCGVPRVDHHFLYDVDNKENRDTYLSDMETLGRDLAGKEP